MTTLARSRWTRPAFSGPPIRIDPVLKPGGGVRHLVRLGPADARRYVAAVRPVLPIVERARGPWAMANRGRVTPDGLDLEDWRAARGRFRAAARSNLDGAASVFLGDVEDCYGSIGSSTVMSALRRLGIDGADAGRVGDILADMERRGVRGLPVGPDASAILGDAVLLLVDHAFAREGLTFLRWVDDVAVFAPDQDVAMHAHDVFRRTLAHLGLRVNEAKTMVVGPDGARARLLGSSISLATGTAHDMIRPP
jgi:Reverse transcriptase (RNA-dependent DNA polymerase)